MRTIRQLLAGEDEIQLAVRLALLALLIYWSYESGREDYEDETAGGTLKGLVSVFAHFFTRTRWDRMLHVIH